jgi:uncharacterized membrane protein
MSSTSTAILVLAVFGASAVEMVEALTIVIAAGVTRGWRPAIEGALGAIVVLSVLVGAVGIPLVRYVPLDTLRVIVGAMLLVLGLSWLRKSILRASGHKALHDEEAIFLEQTTNLREIETVLPPGRHDGIGFTIAFKGVLLEGIEVVLIVVSLGGSDHRLGVAAVAAGAAAVLVAGAGLLVARQLAEVPENTIKTLVGIMLTSFGLFWVGEGAGVRWPGSDLAIPVFVGLFLVTTLVAIAAMRRVRPVEPAQSVTRPTDDPLVDR